MSYYNRNYLLIVFNNTRWYKIISCRGKCTLANFVYPRLIWSYYLSLINFINMHKRNKCAPKLWLYLLCFCCRISKWKLNVLFHCQIARFNTAYFKHFFKGEPSPVSKTTDLIDNYMYTHMFRIGWVKIKKTILKPTRTIAVSDSYPHHCAL